MIIKITGLILVIQSFVTAPTIKCGERIPSPEGVFIYKSAANVFGFEAAWVNPAGLGRFTGSGAVLMADYFDGNFVKSWGALVNGEQSAIAYRKINSPSGKDYQEWVFASGLGLGQLNVGGSYRFFKDGPGIYDNRSLWNAGLQYRGDGKFGAALVLSNLNRSRVQGERSAIEQRYAVSYRPLDIGLTLSVDMIRSSSVKLGDALYIYQISVSPYNGLTLEGLLDSDENFNIAVRANLLEFFVGGESRFDNSGGGRGTTLYVGSNDLQQPSVIPWKNGK